MRPTTSFDRYISQWELRVDGAPIHTASSHLLPVRYQGVPAMLKIPQVEEERRGGLLMVWWAGEGAAHVLAHDKDALLLERAVGTRSLTQFAQQGNDDEASRIICTVAARLHAQRYKPLPELIPLVQWFAALEPAAARYGGVFNEAYNTANELLEAPQDIVVLHGDLHHGNIVDGEQRGWLAIDPKSLLGERGFDFANLFCNPDQKIATNPGRLGRQVQVVAKAAELDPKRLLQWILAYAGLSAAWTLEEMGNAQTALAVAELANSELAAS